MMKCKCFQGLLGVILTLVGPAVSDTMAQESPPQIPVAYTGRDMEVNLSSTMVSAPYALLISARSGPTVTPYGSLGVGLPFYLLATGVTDAQGHARITIPLPAEQGLKGAVFHLAAVYLDTNGPVPIVKMSGGTKVTVQGPLLIVACDWIRMIASAKLEFIDVLEGKILGTLKLGNRPGQLVVSPSGAFAYMTLGKDLQLVDIPGRKLDKIIPTGVGGDLKILQKALGSPYIFGAYPGNRYSTPTLPGEMFCLDTRTDKLLSVVKLAGPVAELHPAGNGALVYATNPLTRDVYIIDGIQGKVVTTITAGRSLDKELFDSGLAGTDLVVATGDRMATGPTATGTLSIIDLAGKLITSTPTMNPRPQLLAMVKSSNQWMVQVSCMWSSPTVSPSMKLYSASPLQYVGSVSGLPAPNPTAMHPILDKPWTAVLWSGNPGYPNTSMRKPGSLSVINTTTSQPLTTIKLDQMYQSAMYTLSNRTVPLMFFAQRNDPTMGGDLRALDLGSMKMTNLRLSLGHLVLQMVDV